MEPQLRIGLDYKQMAIFMGYLKQANLEQLERMKAEIDIEKQQRVLQ